MHHFEYCAPEVQTFWPVTIHSSPFLTARVLTPARSEPASGSLKPWHQISSALRIVGRRRSFWRSSPQTISVGPASSRPSVLTGSGPPERPSSSKKIAVSIREAPRPPYSLGQCTPAHPPSLRRRCQSTRQRSCSASSVGSSPGGLAANQSRSSSRNASCSSVNVRSTGVSPPDDG